eukprot:6473684-Amphidinium_carterae.2
MMLVIDNQTVIHGRINLSAAMGFGRWLVKQRHQWPTQHRPQGLRGLWAFVAEVGVAHCPEIPKVGGHSLLLESIIRPRKRVPHGARGLTRHVPLAFVQGGCHRTGLSARSDREWHKERESSRMAGTQDMARERRSGKALCTNFGV